MPPRRWPARVFAAVLLAATAGAPSLPPAGPTLIEVVSPAPGEVVGIEGLQVWVRFPSGGRIAPETFRVLLNGADVTEAIATGENGAYGELHGLLEGENVLRLEVFGRAPGCARSLLFEQTRVVHVRMRPPLSLHRG
jgi:hypothetical protein